MGRPKKDSGHEDFSDVGPPPDDPLYLAYWLQRVIAICSHQARSRRGTVRGRTSIRASCSAAARLLPAAILYQRLVLDGYAADVGDIKIDEAPPESPFGITLWFLGNICRDIERQIAGRGVKSVSQEWRQGSSAAARALPPDVLVQAKRMVSLQRARERGDRKKSVPLPSRPRSISLGGDNAQ